MLAGRSRIRVRVRISVSDSVRGLTDMGRTSFRSLDECQHYGTKLWVCCNARVVIACTYICSR